MRVLISGATGFVGRSFVESPASESDEFVALVRSPARAAELLPSNVALLQTADEDAMPGVSQRGLIAALESCDAILNLAGEPIIGRWTAAKMRSIVDSRVTTTRALVECMKGLENRPRVMVSASAVGYYGDSDAEVDEDAPAGNDFLASTCAQWEAEALAAESLGLRVCCMRFGVILGRGGALEKMLTPFRLGAGGPIGTGNQWMPWVHLADVVGLLRFALEHESMRGPINVVAPGAVRNAEFAKSLGRAIHRPAVITTPAFALRALYGAGATPLLTGQHAVPKRAVELGYRFRFPTLDRALDDVAASF